VLEEGKMKISGEFELIEKIRKEFIPADRTVTGIGDDAAVIVKKENEKALVSTDTLVEGVHFLKGKISFRDLGYKSITVNMSDIAAMGGVPAYALLTLGLPADISGADMDEFIQGMLYIRDKLPFDLVGGDTVKSPSLFITVTMIGYTKTKPLLRSGARPGDYIYVTGSLGDSAIGLSIITDSLKEPVLDKDYFTLRHYRPFPRVSLMHYLKKRYDINSAIDISDGLLADLAHIADESAAGFRIDIEKLPLPQNHIGPSFESSAEYFYNFAMCGGEDYEIVFTSPDMIDPEFVKRYTGARLTCIGRIIEAGRDVYLNGKKLEWEGLGKGYLHF
jgi:thiamine-monophosphate kinase